MAGAGIRVFSSGEILTAAQVNQYLMDQVITRFADAATRDASFGGVGQPVLTEGRFCYLDSTNVVQYYDGSSWNDASQFTVGDGTITTVKLADGSVTADKIADGTVIAADIADGTITNAKINASAAIADTKLATISTADKVSVSALNIDGATDIGADLTDADLIIVDDGGAGTNRKAAATRISDYVFGKVSGDVLITSNGVASIQANSVALGTDTTGNYMADVSAGTGIAVTHTPAEGSTATVALADSTLVTNAGSYSLTTADKNKIIEITGSSSASVTVPANSSQAFPTGSQVTVIRNGSGTVRVIPAGGVTIRYTPGDYLRAQYSSATLIKRATDEWYLIGDLSA